MSALSDLAAELGMGPDALRSAILSGGEDEALTPNYLTTNPDGTTSADFTGRVHAQGLDLDAVETGLATSMVRWLTATGAVVGDIVTEITGPTAFTDIQTTSPDGSRQSYIEILQSNGGAVPTVSDYIRATLELGGAVKQADILRGDGSSDFVQNDSTKNPNLTWITPGLNAGWSIHPSYVSFGYAKDALGIVHLRGVLVTTGATSTPFTFPVGFRPASDRRYPVSYWTGAAEALGVSNISFSTGVFGIFNNADAVAAMNFVTLDLIQFPTT